MFKILFGAMALVATAAGAAPAKFDLVCAGPDQNVAPTYHYRYVLDLQTKAYCKTDESLTCGTLVEVSPGSITVQDLHRSGISVVESINRVDGTALLISRISTEIKTQSGRCTVAPFSGFPSTKF